MRLAIASLILTVAASGSLAQDAKKDDLKGDLAKVQGKWMASVGPNKDIPLTLDFKGNKVTILVTFNGEENTIKGEFKIDDTKNPKTWDWTKFEGPNGENLGENLAVYKLEGDKLTINSGGPGKDRPKDFMETGAEGANLVEFTRVKEEPKKEEVKKEAK